MPVILLSLATLLPLILSGCSVYPISGHPTEEFPEKSEAQALIGSTREQVIQRLGSPDFQFRVPDGDYFIYEAPGEVDAAWAYLFPYIILPLPAETLIDEAHYVLFCALFEFDVDSRVESYRTEWIGDSCGTQLWSRSRQGTLISHLKKRAMQGDPNAVTVLARVFDLPQSEIPLVSLRARVREGDVDAAVALVYAADETAPLESLAKRSAEARKALEEFYPWNITTVAGLTNEQLLSRAEQGDREAQLQLYWNTVAYDISSAHRWVCRAADQGHPDARYRIGLLYHYGNEGLPRDSVWAYVWYSLAANTGNHNAARTLEWFTPEIQPSQIKEGDRLIHAWRPGECEAQLAGPPTAKQRNR